MDAKLREVWVRRIAEGQMCVGTFAKCDGSRCVLGHLVDAAVEIGFATGKWVNSSPNHRGDELMFHNDAAFKGYGITELFERIGADYDLREHFINMNDILLNGKEELIRGIKELK